MKAWCLLTGLHPGIVGLRGLGWLWEWERRGHSTAGSCLQAPPDMMRLLLGSDCHKAWGSSCSSCGLWFVWARMGKKPFPRDTPLAGWWSSSQVALKAGWLLTPGCWAPLLWRQESLTSEYCRGMRRSGKGTSAWPLDGCLAPCQS